MKIKNDEIIFCIKCKEEIIPFQRLTNQQFHVTTKGINKDIEGINQTFTPSNNVKSFFKGINELNQPRSKNNDDNTPELNCNYVDIDSFNYIKKRKDFSLFHLNIALLSKHKEELETLLTVLDYKFDDKFEIKIIKNITPTYDINLKGYKHYYTPTESVKGGALIYINEQYNSKPRKDLDTLAYKTDQLESIFVEIINPGKKNTLIGCIYRHPSMDLKEFNDEILNPLMEELSLESKNIYLMGDYNIDLMKIEVDVTTSQFLILSLPTYSYHISHVLQELQIQQVN